MFFAVNIIKNIMVNDIKPLADWVVVKPVEKEKKTTSGIIIPDNNKEKPQDGIVICVGPGKKDQPMTVKDGDHILFSKYGVSEFKYGDETFFIMKESDIYAIIK